MMSNHHQILVFGDLTSAFNNGLQVLLLQKENALLTTFFERVAFALRDEIGRLSFHERESVESPNFTTLIDLLTKLKGNISPSPALQKALTCVHQFASVIARYSSVGEVFPSTDETHVVGLCTGLLTRAAFRCCQSLSDLIPIAVHTVIVAFRTGLCVHELRERIEPRDISSTSLQSWTVMVPGLTEKSATKALDEYCTDKGLQTTSKPYISSYARTGITLSGPPSVLDELIKSKYLPKSSTLRLPINAPYHAAHLYNVTDLDKILEPSTGTRFWTWKDRYDLPSNSFDSQGQVATFGSLLRSALAGILFEPLRIDILSHDIAIDIQSLGVQVCIILPVATSASQAFVTAISVKSSTTSTTVDNSMNKIRNIDRHQISDSGHLGHSKLAIVGYSGRFPDANTTEEFWDILHEGRDVASETPKQRWNVETHVDPTLKKKNTSATPYGCWLKDPGNFDAKFFYMSPREAPQVDPAQRLALMTAYEAMENAGLVPEATPSTQRDRIGVFYGTTSNDWGETNSSQDVDTYYIPGSCRAFIPGRQNFFFKFSGPSYSVDTACSSSLAAMHLACNSLWRGDIDTAISGGTNVMTNPDITAGLDRGHFLSRTGNCKTFDDDADGYCRGEGVVSVVIKRLEDALADNDPVLAIILGAYTNHSAEAESITRPHVGAQKAIFEKILSSSAVDPSSIGYVEMHGTGTQAGDAREMESVLSTFTPTSKLYPRSEPLFLGSAKANVGHGESVSGVIALSKVLLMLEKNEIPPHCGIKNKLNSKFPKDMTDRNVFIARKPTPWLRSEGKPRRALINNFSAAGGNSSLLIEDPPEVSKRDKEDPRSTQIVTVSAKSPTALVENIQALISFIEKTSPSLASLSYTSTARRTHHAYRTAVSGASLSDINSQLAKSISSENAKSRAKPTVAFAFTGQGAQYASMGIDLLHFSSFRNDIERLDSIAQKQGFSSIMPLITSKDIDIADCQPVVVQLATTCIQISLAQLWKSWGIEPCCVVGHSLGEYAALNVAGVLSDADTIYLTGKRAQLLQDLCTRDTHSMLAISASVPDVRMALQSLRFDIACINAPTETVVSGLNADIDQILEVLATKSWRKARLRVPFAFHSSQVESILEDFVSAARGITFHAPKIPVLSPLLSEVVTSQGTFGPVYLSRHCREPVNLLGALQTAKDTIFTDQTAWIEIGPHPVVLGLLKSTLGPVTVLPSLQRNKDTWKVVTGTLSALYEAGNNIRWAEYQRDFASSLSVLKLPSYRWDLKNYWMQYVNDWSLYKGDAAFLAGVQAPAFTTTCVQRLVQENTENGIVTIIGESDLLRSDLDPFVRGHRVNGVALCTPSVYAEMALVLGDYIRRQQAQWAGALVDVMHMDVQKPLAILSKGKGPQYLRCRIIFNTVTTKGALEFYSVSPEGKKLTKHAECTIIFADSVIAAAETQATAATILDRMDQLRTSLLTNERVQKLKGSSGYQLVSSLASYDDEYRGVAEVILDSQNLEAVAKVKFESVATDKASQGTFSVNPYLIDNFGQPALFTMNANDQANLEKEVFVNHGWSSLHFYKAVSIDKTYHSYVRMDGPKEDGMYSGDMTVFDGDEVVACYKGVKAQGVPRRLMDYIVKMRDDTQTDLPRAATHPITQGASNLEHNSASNSSPSASWSEALNIIAEESGVPVAELTPDKAFADMGVDSLLSLLCASRFREELGLVYESSIFEENPTVKDLKAFWDKGATSTTVSGGDAVLNSMFHDDGDASSESSQSRTESFESINFESESSPKVAATSLLLQGNPKSNTTKKTLFLLPDGSGSASSYAYLPTIHESIAIVALNCPFMKQPALYGHGIDLVANAYVSEIRRRQPLGPYSLGGWSVGGIFAFRCAQLLSSAGQSVEDLVLLDCPVPRGLDHLPKRYFEYCEKIGLLGAIHTPTGTRKSPPAWLIPHFEACVDSLHDYHASPFETATSNLKTHVIWACNSIDADVEIKFERRKEDPEGLKFLTEERVDFGPCGWETLLPLDSMRFFNVQGANHFSMMKGDGAVVLAKAMGKALMVN